MAKAKKALPSFRSLILTPALKKKHGETLTNYGEKIFLCKKYDNIDSGDGCEAADGRPTQTWPAGNVPHCRQVRSLRKAPGGWLPPNNILSFQKCRPPPPGRPVGLCCLPNLTPLIVIITTTARQLGVLTGVGHCASGGQAQMFRYHWCQMAEFRAAGPKNGRVKFLAA